MLNIKDSALAKSFQAMPIKNKRIAGSSLLVVGSLLGFGAWAVFGSSADKIKIDDIPGSKTTIEGTKPLKNAGIDQTTTSKEYDQIVKEKAAEDAAKSKQNGTSHITNVADVTWGEIDPPAKPKASVQTTTKTVGYSYSNEELKEMQKNKFDAMKAYYDSISQVSEVNGGEVVRGTYVAAEAKTTSNNGMGTSIDVGNSSDENYYPISNVKKSLSSVSETPGFSPGDVLLASTKYAVNSDTTSTIIAEVVTGPLAGANVPLSVKREGEYVVFQSINISWNRYSSSFKAIAIDPGVVASNAFSTSTDRHIFYRYGSLFLSAFAEGAGDMAEKANSTVTVDGTTVIEDNSVGTKEYVIAGVGKIGSKLGAIAERNFNTPPTVHVDAHTKLALVVIDEAQIPWLPSPYIVKKTTAANSTDTSNNALNNNNEVR